MTEITTTFTTQLIELPESGSLSELWDTLEYPEVGGQPHPSGRGVYGPGAREIEGVHRRLAAGISSVSRRGTSRDNLTIGLGNARWGGVSFCWQSQRGTWTRRHWRVTGTLHLLASGEIRCEGVVLAVESTARRGEAVSEWTAFTGGPLDRLLADRLGWVIAQFGARFLHQQELVPAGWAADPLTDEEVEAYHDLHTSPMAAWVTPTGRVVLSDDDYGSAHLVADEAAKVRLVEIGLGLFAPTEIDTGLPVSGFMPEPVAAPVPVETPEPEVEPTPDWERELLGMTD